MGSDFRKGKESSAWDASQMVVPFNPNNEGIVNTSNLYLQTSIKCCSGNTSAAVHNCAHIVGCYYCFWVMLYLFAGLIIYISALILLNLLGIQNVRVSFRHSIL